jgi:WD40 repeat protein
MKEKQTFIDKLRFLGLVLVFMLTSCARGNPLPATTTEAGIASSLVTPTDTVIPSSMQLITSTPTASPTSSATATSTANPNGYTLVGWREPTEVITPENMDRVEKIGQLESADNLWQFAFSPDGSWFGVGIGWDILILDQIAFNFYKQFSFVSSGFIAFSYDGQILETNGVQYDITTGQQISSGMTVSPFPGATMDIEFSPNGQYTVAAGSDHLSIYPMKAGIERGAFGRPAQPWHASVSPDSKLIAVNYWDESFTEIWDPYLRQPVKILKLKDINGQGKPRFSKDGKSLFFTGNGTWEGQQAVFFQEWDYLSGRPIHVQVIPGESWESGFSMDISPVSGLAAVGTMDGKIYLLPFRDCKAIQIGDNDQTEDTLHKRIDMVAFRPDGKLLVSLKPYGNKIEFWGIPASEAGREIVGPVENATDTPVTCPNIPMIVEHPTPETDWWGGGRPRK